MVNEFKMKKKKKEEKEPRVLVNQTNIPPALFKENRKLLLVKKQQ